jgi:hypothetical protein
LDYWFGAVVTISWLGAATAIAGSAALALNKPWSRWGWVLYIFSNALWVIYGVVTQQWSIVTMQVMFFLISAIGIYRWFAAASGRPMGSQHA